MSMPAALQSRRTYAGPPLFSYGFRPFFLVAALWAAFNILLWVPQYLGSITAATEFSALDWHIHEMLYGYVAAAIAGFLLTAIPNWTGRLPVNGWPLAGLVLLWLAGRAAILLSKDIGGFTAALVDASFLLALAIVAAREIIAGKNWRNLRVMIILAVLILGNIVFHLEVLLKGSADYGVRIAISAIVLLISLVGGRVVPSFTNNWLARNNPGRLPVPFSRFDVATIATAAVSLAAWIAAPAHPVSGMLLL
ncbi:MAG: NnrS family protein, partial [Pseudolabrys sp.]